MLAFLMASAFLAGFAVHRCREVAAPADIQSLTEGEWTSLYEEVFNKSLTTYDISKNSWGLLNYTFFREGNDGVLIGDDNWLFTTEEFFYQPDWEENYKYNLEFIRTVSAYLRRSNIELLIVPVPSKARIYEDMLGRYEYPDYKKAIYPDFVRRMKTQDISVIDLMPAFKKKKDAALLFLKSDTHWTPAGAALAAELAGHYVNRLYPNFLYEKRNFVTEVRGKIALEGDLLRYVPLGPLTDDLGLAADRIPNLETVEAGNRQVGLQDALFSDSTPPVTLVGTSYSANPAWNFDGFLKQSINADVLNAADEGLGPFETMKEYLSNDAFKSSPPRLLIWEIPERYLTFSYDLKHDFYNKES